MATKTRWREHISHGPTGGLAETQAVVGLWGRSANREVADMETATPKFFDRRGLKTWSCNLAWLPALAGPADAQSGTPGPTEGRGALKPPVSPSVLCFQKKWSFFEPPAAPPKVLCPFGP